VFALALSNAVAGIPPVVTAEPLSLTVNYRQSATLSVSATGTAPLVYQWFGGLPGDTNDPITGATNASFSSSALFASTSFWVEVQNLAGAADSNTATVTVLPPPLPSLAVHLVSGLPSLTLTGQQGTTYEIQFWGDLANPLWTTLTGFSLPASSITVGDSQAAGLTRFYRAVSP
jgi:hypothetical protein